MRIAVIEDDVDISELLCVVLAEDGYAPHPILAATGALAAVVALMPAAILLDLMLPGGEGSPEQTAGEWVGQQLTHDARTAAIPVLLISAVTGLREAAACIGTPWALAKPLDWAALFDMLTAALPPGSEGRGA